MSTAVATQEWVRHNRPTIGRKEQEAVSRVLASGNLVRGPVASAFERALANRLGMECVVVSSGTAALTLAMRTMARRWHVNGVSLPTYSCASLLRAAITAGLEVDLLDADVSDFNARGTSAADLAVVAHTFGCPAPVRPALATIEDASQALGAVPIGRVGDLCVMSFRAPKPITTGHGGAVFGSSSLLEEVRELLDYDSPRPGEAYNYEMSDVAAAIGLAQLERLDWMTERRAEIAKRYDEARPRWMPRQTAQCTRSNHWRYVVMCPIGAERMARHFESRMIEAIQPVRTEELLHRMLGYDPDAFPGAEEIAAKALSLPIWPGMSDHEVNRVCHALRSLS